MAHLPIMASRKGRLVLRVEVSNTQTTDSKSRHIQVFGSEKTGEDPHFLVIHSLLDTHTLVVIQDLHNHPTYGTAPGPAQVQVVQMLQPINTSLKAREN